MNIVFLSEISYNEKIDFNYNIELVTLSNLTLKFKFCR